MRYNTLKLTLAAVACLSVMSFAAFPVMRITTQNNQDPTVSGGGMFGGAQTMKYVKITNFTLTDPNNSRNNLTLTPEPQGEADSIRVRGNSTAGIADKRPYRIKFDKKQGLFGKEKAKSWVLLANYYDGTFTMNAIAFRLGQKLGLAFTPTSQFVNVYLNNQYKGIYQLTEQIQVNPGRVDIHDSLGFIVEFDYHDAASDEVKFTAANYSLPVFIKAPEIESNFNVNNTRIKFVKDSIDALTRKMAESGFPTNGYRDMIDLESFAKYVLIQQLMDNFDFNSKTQTGGLPGSNYAYKDVGTRLYAGPLWDFDLSAGVQAPAQMGGFPGMGGGGGCDFPAHFCVTNEPIKPKHAFYQRLWEDPVFLAKFKKAWDAHKSDFSAIPTFIDSIAGVLRDSVGNNKYANPTGGLMGGAATLNTSTYNQHITSMKNWWNSRMTFFGNAITSMNIDTSKDIIQPAPSSSSRPSSSSVAASSSSVVPSSSSVVSSSSNRPSSSSASVVSSSSRPSSSSVVSSSSRPSSSSSRPSSSSNRPSSSSATSSNSNNPSSSSGQIAPIVHKQIATGNGILAIKNGVNLQVRNTASLSVYNLSGKLERAMNFNNGVYSVPLGDLPKGMYIVNASFGSEKQILRVLIK